MTPEKNSSLVDMSQGVECMARPVTAELEAGRKLNLERNCISLKKESSTGSIKPLYIRRKKNETEKNRKIQCGINKNDRTLWKMVYPKAPKLKKCHHHDNFIINRQILTRSEHINVLSKPHKSIVINNKPKKVPRSIPPMTNRMNKLAQPKERDVILTWKKYASVLGGRQVDKFFEIVSSYKVMNNKGATEYLKQCKRDERMRRKYQQQEVKKLREEVKKIYLEQIKESIFRVFNEVNEYLCGHEKCRCELENTEITEKIRIMVSEYLKCKDLTKTGKVKQKAIKNLTERVSKWAEAFLEAAKCKTEETDIEENIEVRKQDFGGYPIDDFILVDEESMQEEGLLCEASICRTPGDEDDYEVDYFNEKDNLLTKSYTVETLLESLPKITVPRQTI